MTKQTMPDEAIEEIRIAEHTAKEIKGAYKKTTCIWNPVDDAHNVLIPYLRKDLVVRKDKLEEFNKYLIEQKRLVEKDKHLSFDERFAVSNCIKIINHKFEKLLNGETNE